MGFKLKLQSKFRRMLTRISPTLNTKVCYRVKYGKQLDLNNPKTLDEKILYLKLKDYGTNELVKVCADKYRVREYIHECGCDEITAELLKVYDNVSEIEWDSLPDKFAMKLNIGCGANIICTDKSQLNYKECERKLKKWSNEKYYLGYSEMQYKGVEPKIIVEQYLNDGSGLLPLDYKVYCFNGKAEYVMICAGRETGKTLYFYYDREWNLMPFSKDALDNPEYKLNKPKCVDALFNYADILSKPFPFVRADFYIINDKIYFGELTFTPSAGMDPKRLPNVNSKFGEMVDLNYGQKC